MDTGIHQHGEGAPPVGDAAGPRQRGTAAGKWNRWPQQKRQTVPAAVHPTP